MSQDSLAYYQRIVCIGLRRMTKDSTLIRSGFLHWNEVFAKKEFNIEESVSELVSYLGLTGGDKKLLMIAFHAANNKLFDELPAVPEVLLKMITQLPPAGIADDSLSLGFSGANEEIVIAKAPQLIVTEKFLEYLTIFLGKYSKNDLFEFKGILIDEGIPNAKQSIDEALIKWAAIGFSRLDLPDDTSESECSDTSHKLYLLISEIIGPVAADKIVHAAIDESLKLEAASRFSPRNLL